MTGWSEVSYGMFFRLGFLDVWVKLIMSCVVSPSFSILVNGLPKRAFRPSRGIRQGDPFFPFLLLFITEGLSALLRDAISSGWLTSVVVASGSPTISHLLFANDSLIFHRDMVGCVHELHDVL